MKTYHFALIFLIFFLAAIISTDISIGKLKAIENEKAVMTTALDTGTSDAINYLAESGVFGADSINKEGVIATFFTSLYSSMGIISDIAAQTEIEMYIPVILLCDIDGYYVYYYENYMVDGLTFTKRLWSEKMPYYYEDEYFTYSFTLADRVTLYDKNNYLNTSYDVINIDYHELQTEAKYAEFRSRFSGCIMLNDENYELTKKGAIINQLEEVMAIYTSKHNTIARWNGISYTFSFPAKQEDEWACYMDDVNFLVVFQGYPYGASRDYTFNKIASVGANLIKKDTYYVEKRSWYNLAHLKACPKLAESTTVLEETYDNIDECVKFGAYCCECIEHGARVPEIK